MGWKEYRAKMSGERKRFTLEPLGASDFWVEIKSGGEYTVADIEEIGDRYVKLRMTMDSKLSIPLILASLDIERIVAWNLTDPNTDSKDVLPLPSVDMTVLAKIPTRIQWHIKEQIDSYTEEAIPPKYRALIARLADLAMRVETSG